MNDQLILQQNRGCLNSGSRHCASRCRTNPLSYIYTSAEGPNDPAVPLPQNISDGMQWQRASVLNNLPPVIALYTGLHVHESGISLPPRRLKICVCVFVYAWYVSLCRKAISFCCSKSYDKITVVNPGSPSSKVSFGYVPGACKMQNIG